MALFFLALRLDERETGMLRSAATVALVPRSASTIEGYLPSSRTSRAPIEGRSKSTAVAKVVATVGHREVAGSFRDVSRRGTRVHKQGGNPDMAARKKGARKKGGRKKATAKKATRKKARRKA